MKQMTKEEMKSYGDTLPLGDTYDEQGYLLTFRDSEGNWSVYTRDADGRVLTYKDSDGNWHECTYDEQGYLLTFRDSEGYRLVTHTTNRATC